MRDIEFRGIVNNKTYDGNFGKWVFGGLVRVEWDDDDPDYWISSKNRHWRVNPETIGQYTGLKDKKGVKIFEGDIVKLINGALFEICYGIFLPNPIKEYCKGIRRKANQIIGFYGKHLAGGVEGAEGEEVVLTDYSAAYEVIDNIHDNPELLHAGGAR
jgi:uncharacterized phage protein (TIGR01671 family)